MQPESSEPTLSDDDKNVGKWQIIFLILLCLLVFITLYFSITKSDKVVVSTNNLSTTIISVSRGDVTSSVSQSGSVISKTDFFVNPKVQRRVTGVFVKVGDYVKEGDVLGTMDNQSETTALVQAKVALNVQVIQISNAESAIQAAQDIAASNTLSYQNAIDTAWNSLNSIKSQIEIKANNYQNAIDQAQVTFDQNQSLYNSYLAFYASSGLSLEYCKTLNSVNANCTQLMQYYVNYQNSQIALQTAKQNQALNKKSDDLQLSNLSSNYQTALLQKENGLQKDQQAVSTAQRNYATLATQFGVSVVNPTPKDFTLAQLAISNAQENLDATYVKAPMSGLITQIGARLGQVAPNGSYDANGKRNNMFTISKATYQMQCIFNLIDGPKVRLGQISTITFTGINNPVRLAKVVQLSPVIANEGTPPGIEVSFSLEGKNSDIYPGLLGKATVAIRGRKDVVRVPNVAIIQSNGKSFVNLLQKSRKSSKVIKQPIKVGLVGNTSSEIISGVKEGDLIQFTTPKITRP